MAWIGCPRQVHGVWSPRDSSPDAPSFPIDPQSTCTLAIRGTPFDLELCMSKLLSRVTPQEARDVWNRLPNPSCRQVAMLFKQSGRRIDHTTINRWRSQGWRAVPNMPHPLELAKEAVDLATPLLSGDPMTTAEDLGDAETRAELQDLTEEELLRRAVREAFITQIVLGQEIRRAILESW